MDRHGEWGEYSLMSAHTYKMIELVGSSTIGIEDAVQNAVSKAALTEKNLRWLEVVETRAHLENGKIAHWQVTVKIGATLEA
jgi:flavin-binding protein dodecin